MTNLDEVSPLSLEIAGFLSMLSQGLLPPNWREQATELFNKLGDALNHDAEDADADPH